jgi:hypothetical protein
MRGARTENPARRGAKIIIINYKLEEGPIAFPHFANDLEQGDECSRNDIWGRPINSIK